MFLVCILSGGKKLLELNRILRPGGYFVLSEKHSSIEKEEGLAWSNLISSLLVIEDRIIFYVKQSMEIALFVTKLSLLSIFHTISSAF